MVSNLLYDKVISVTLVKKETQQRTVRVHKAMGYGETRVKGRRVLFSSSKNDDIVTDPVTGMDHSVTATITFYEGNSYFTYSGYKKDKDRYVRHIAKGPLYKYSTMEEMQKGVHPDGSLMKTGDRAYVTETRKTWSVVVTGTEEALLDSTVSSIDYKEKLTIECPDSGMKPDMTFSVSLLPNQNCYKAVLRIRNLNIRNADIRLWDSMEITAGYRTGPKAKFICPIFASYIESPNPDGITVFEGITVGRVESMLNDRAIEINFVQESITLDDLIRGAADCIMEGMAVDSAIPADLSSKVITVSKQKVYAENGLAVLNWLQVTVAKAVEELSHGQCSVLVQLDNQDKPSLSIIVLNGENVVPVSTENIIDLRMVSGATFNGTALTVEAPWNPGLHPGELFYMSPQFIQGSHLPNVLDEVSYKNVDNLYRTLTMSISFGTTDNTNKMTILAVPAQYAGETSIRQTTDMTPEMYAALKVSEREIEKGNLIRKEIGKASGVERAAMEVVAKETGVTMFDAHKNLPGFAFMNMNIDAGRTGNCLSLIGEYYCFVTENGPRLDSSVKGTSGKAGRYYKTVEELKNNAKALEHFQSTGIPCSTLWWPLIAIATYWRWQEDKSSGVSNNWMHINLDNPDFLTDGKALLIPIFSSYEALTGIKDVYKDAYKDYKDKYPSYSLQWRAMYYMLGGTDDLE